MSYSSYHSSKRDYKGSSYVHSYNKQIDSRNSIIVPTSLSTTSSEDRVLMEIEIQLEGLKSLLEKNEDYSKKLRTSLQKINEKHKENMEKLKELHHQKNEIQLKAKVNKYGFSATYGVNLYGHKIQGIPFYQFENYQRLDCIQAFELMSRKNNKILKQQSHDQQYMNSYYSYDSDKVMDPKKEEMFQAFFEKLPQIKDKLSRSQKQNVDQFNKFQALKEESASMLSEDIERKQKHFENSTSLYQDCMEKSKKEFIILLIFNFIDEQFDLTRMKEHSQNTHGIKKEPQQSQQEFFKQILQTPTYIYNYIDWLEFAKFANLQINKYGATSMLGYIEALEIFSAFKELYTKLGESFIQLILSQANKEDSSIDCASISSFSQSPIGGKKNKKASNMNSTVSFFDDSIKKNGKKESQSSILQSLLSKSQYNIFQKSQQIQSSEWTRQDDEKLMRGVQIFGEKRWGQVSTQLNGKEHTDIVQRWVKFLNPRIEKGRWSLREDLKLSILYEFYYSSKEKVENKTWCLIANHFTNRTEVQIRERWCNLLDPKMKFTSWSKQEDNLLLLLGVKYQGQWAKISRDLENKTDNQVLRRWKLLLSDRYNINLIKGLDFSSINLRNEYLRHHGHLQEELPQYIQQSNNANQKIYNAQNEFVNVKEEIQELSQFLPQVKCEASLPQLPEPKNIYRDFSFSYLYYNQNMNQNSQEDSRLPDLSTDISQPLSQNQKHFTLKRDDEEMDIEQTQQSQQQSNTNNQIIRVASELVSMPPKTKSIFKLIKLSPALSDQIRKDNHKRREKKKYKKRPAGYKQKAYVMSTSQIDNASTFRSNFGEEDDSEDDSLSGMNFTEYQSDTNNDPTSYNTSNLIGQKRKINKKIGHNQAISASQLKMQNMEEDGYQSESKGSEIPSI